MITINYYKIRQHQQDLLKEAKNDREAANCKRKKSNPKIRFGKIIDMVLIN